MPPLDNRGADDDPSVERTVRVVSENDTFDRADDLE